MDPASAPAPRAASPRWGESPRSPRSDEARRPPPGDDRGPVDQILIFAFTAMINPTLVAATTVMLVIDNPRRLMLGYLMGAMMTSVTIGLVIVFALQDSGTVDTAKRTINPIADLVIGGLLLVIALVLGTGRHEGLAE